MADGPDPDGGGPADGPDARLPGGDGPAAGPGDRGPAPDSRSPAGPDPLVVWCLATFHAAFLVAVGVLALHRSGAAGDLLAGLGTLQGFALFLALWTVTWWTTRRWLAEATVDARAGTTPSVGASLVPALKWGGLDGLVFLLFLVAVLLVPNAVAAGTVSAVYVLALLVLVGSLVAAVVGALVGGLFALVDLALLRAAGYGPRPGAGRADAGGGPDPEP